MKNINFQQLKRVYANMGYSFFEEGAYNLNIFGIRNELGKVDEFNDIIGIAYKDDIGLEHVINFIATTDPGLYWLKNGLGNSKGTAILCPGQYRACWKLGFHKGYQALQQSPKSGFKVWRDSNSNGDLDTSGPIYNDVTGLNCHTTSFINEIERVGKYSAGCQVIQDDLDFQIFLSIIKKSAAYYGELFSYTLFNNTDLA